MTKPLSERISELLDENVTLPNYLQDYEIEAIREAAALARRVEGSGRAYVFKKTAPEPHQISGVLVEDDDLIEALDGKRVRLVPEVVPPSTEGGEDGSR